MESFEKTGLPLREKDLKTAARIAEVMQKDEAYVQRWLRSLALYNRDAVALNAKLRRA